MRLNNCTSKSKKITEYRRRMIAERGDKRSNSMRWGLILQPGWLDKLYAAGVKKRNVIKRNGVEILPIFGDYTWREFAICKSLGMDKWVRVMIETPTQVGYKPEVHNIDAL